MQDTPSLGSNERGRSDVCEKGYSPRYGFCPATSPRARWNGALRSVAVIDEAIDVDDGEYYSNVNDGDT